MPVNALQNVPRKENGKKLKLDNYNEENSGSTLKQ